MTDEFEKPGDGSRELLNAYLIEFIIKFRRSLTKKQKNGDVHPEGSEIDRIMELVQKNVSDSFDLSSIAGKAFMSVSHFSKSFKEKTGKSPKNYFITSRIEKAKELLRSTEKTAKILGIPKASLENWVRLNAKGQLKGASDKPVNPEQMELARLRAELARVKMERDILKKATAYFARESL